MGKPGPANAPALARAFRQTRFSTFRLDLNYLACFRMSSLRRAAGTAGRLILGVRACPRIGPAGPISGGLPTARPAQDCQPGVVFVFREQQAPEVISGFPAVTRFPLSSPSLLNATRRPAQMTGAHAPVGVSSPLPDPMTEKITPWDSNHAAAPSQIWSRVLPLRYREVRGNLVPPFTYKP
jgi:hypothetical protein